VRTKFENITGQVDGITDTFTTVSPFAPGSLSLGYNGQLYPKGVNILTELPPNQFKLSFAPALDTHSLLVVYEYDDGLSSTEPILLASALPPRSP
jgi:hypothetical protein